MAEVIWDRDRLRQMGYYGSPLWSVGAEETAACGIAVYALTDPFTGYIRYIGQTRQSPEDRLNGHIRDALQGVGRRGDAHPPKTAWICSVLARGERPHIRLIGYAHPEWVDFIERSLIAELWLAGVPLVNALGTPREWCAGASAKTCPHGNAHSVTTLLDHETFILLRLYYPISPVDESVASIVADWVNGQQYRRYCREHERDEDL